MSFELASILGIGSVSVFLAYISVKSNLHPRLKTFLIFLSLLGLLLLVQEIRLIAGLSVTSTDLNLLLDTTYSVLIWSFFFIGSTTAIVSLFSYFKNDKIKDDESSNRTQ